MATKKKMQLYQSFPYRALRCMWLVRELDIEQDVECIPFDFLTASPESMEKYKEEVHPHGTLPGFIDDGESMVDSAAICLYLADKYDKLQPPPGERLHYYNWPIYCSATVDWILQPVYYNTMDKPKDQWDQELLEKQGEKFDAFANYFTRHFKDRQFVCGDQFTAADCVVGYTIWWSSFIMDGAWSNKFPVLVKYLERVSSRPAFKETFKFPENFK